MARTDRRSRCVVPNWESLGVESRTVDVWLSMNYFIAVGPLQYEYQEGGTSQY
jgi:hypothetical protein